MRQVGTALVGLAFCCADQVMANTAEPWPAIEKALKGPFVQVESINKMHVRRFQLSAVRCPTIPVEDQRAYAVTVRFEAGRALKMDMLVARLPVGFNAYGPIVAAAHEPGSDEFLDGCLMPKSGLSLLQCERYLFVFPTVCQDAYPYRKSLPVVLKALQEFWGPRFPERFISAPCGTIFPRLVYRNRSHVIIVHGILTCRGQEADAFAPD